MPTDPYKQQEKDTLGKGMSTADLVANYPDRAWCKNDTDAATDTTNCRVNSAYTYPNWEFNRRHHRHRRLRRQLREHHRFGRPYYYRMTTAQWCSTSNGAAGTCVSGNSVNPTSHRNIFPGSAPTRS